MGIHFSLDQMAVLRACARFFLRAREPASDGAESSHISNMLRFLRSVLQGFQGLARDGKQVFKNMIRPAQTESSDLTAMKESLGVSDIFSSTAAIFLCLLTYSLHPQRTPCPFIPWLNCARWKPTPHGHCRLIR